MQYSPSLLLGKTSVRKTRPTPGHLTRKKSKTKASKTLPSQVQVKQQATPKTLSGQIRSKQQGRMPVGSGEQSGVILPSKRPVGSSKRSEPAVQQKIPRNTATQPHPLLVDRPTQQKRIRNGQKRFESIDTRRSGFPNPE